MKIVITTVKNETLDINVRSQEDADIIIDMINDLRPESDFMTNLFVVKKKDIVSVEIEEE